MEKLKFESLKGWSKETRILLLRALDFDSDGTFVLDSNGERVLDRYTKDSIKINNMAILPTKNSTVIIDWNPLSFISFLEEYSNDIDLGAT